MKQEEKRNREKKELLKKAVRQKKKSTCWKIYLPTFNCWKLKKHLIFNFKAIDNDFCVQMGKYTQNVFLFNLPPQKRERKVYSLNNQTNKLTKLLILNVLKSYIFLKKYIFLYYFFVFLKICVIMQLYENKGRTKNYEINIGKR